MTRHATARFAITITVCCLITLCARADSVTFGREQSGDYAPNKWDDVAWRIGPWNLNTHPTTGYMQAGDRATSGAVTLLAIKDMFTLLPATSSGDEIVIDSASMDIMSKWNVGVTCNATLSRITTDWLLYAAGTNESNVDWDDRDISDANTDALEWTHNPSGSAGVAGSNTSWGASDYTTVNEQTALWTGGWLVHTTWDITDLLSDAYAADENYGWLLSGDGALLTVATSEEGAAEPQLVIDYHYEAPTGSVMLTVISGSGSGGGSYLPGSVVDILADTPPTGSVFDAWTGDTTGIDDVGAADIFIVTQASHATITATYAESNYTLTIVNGSGGGSYSYLEQVAISADAPPTGMEFFVWMGDTDLLDDHFAAATTLTMPAGDASVSATYMNAGDLSLTVYSGSGSGIYTAGQAVAISADPPSTAAKAFYKWFGDTAGIVDEFAADTTITMPASSAVITAVYTDAVQYTIAIRQDSSDQYTYALFDDVEMSFSQWNHNTDYAGTTMDVTYGDERGNGAVGLIGVADLFSILPLSSGGNPILIHEAQLTVRTQVTSGINGTVQVNRVLTDWLVNAAGFNQSNVNSDASDAAGQLEWVTDPDGSASQDWPSSWGQDDYDLATGVSKTWDAGWNVSNTFAVGQLIKDIFETGENYGLVMRMTAVGDNDGGNGNGIINITSAMSSDSTYPPILEITYSYGEPTQMYNLTVVSGNGSGEHQAGLDIPISGGTPPADMEFNIWIGDVDNIADIEAASTTINMPHGDTAITATWKAAGVPTDWWPTFNEWCSQFFGAQREPLAYEMFGNDLEFMTLSDSEYVHESETSACIAFETNLPAMTSIEYGETAAYGQSVDIETDRYHYIHVGYLRGLNNNTTYHYRLVAEDERGNVITSPDKTFATATPANVVYVPGNLGDAPYTLEANKYYLVTQDIAADHTAFYMTSSNVTLDLGGHTVSYNNIANPPTPPVGDPNYPYSYTTDADYGVVSFWSQSNQKIVNGHIVQGAGSNTAYGSGTGYSPIAFFGASGEIAGITGQWHSNQAKGFQVTGSTHSHHNVLIDRGWELTSRHQGNDAITTGSSVHHNLIKRARHRCINGGGEIYNNEIYGDTWYTNAFGINASDNTTVHDNRVFGGGYMFQGIAALGAAYSGGTSDPNLFARNITVRDNFVHLQAVEPYTNRSLEYGPKSAVHSARVMWGADNVVYHDNMLISYAHDGGDTRGIWVETESINTDVVFRDNVVKSIFENDIGGKWGCVAVGGYTSSPDAVMRFDNNRIISNYCMIRFAESYGSGNNTLWTDNTFIKEGQDRPDYAMIYLGYSSGPTRQHYLYDSLFEGGASYDDVIYGGSSERWFVVGWTLRIETEPFAGVVIDDFTGAEVFNGAADASGICQVELDQYRQQETGRNYYTDHTITVTTASDTYVETITMDATKTLQIPQVNYWPGDLNRDLSVDVYDLNMILIDWSRSVPNLADPRSDADGSGTVDVYDLNYVLIDWGKTGYATP